VGLEQVSLFLQGGELVAHGSGAQVEIVGHASRGYGMRGLDVRLRYEVEDGRPASIHDVYESSIGTSASACRGSRE
jgi:hypothetical protein